MITKEQVERVWRAWQIEESADRSYNAKECHRLKTEYKSLEDQYKAEHGKDWWVD